jgi:hypothetical protein
MVTFDGSDFHAATKSCTVLNGESAGTKMAPGSSISFAMAVASDALIWDPLVYVAPTTPSPMVIMRSPLPRSFINRAIATVPPAPITLKTSTRPVMSWSSMIFTAVRAVRS